MEKRIGIVEETFKVDLEDEEFDDKFKSREF